MENVDVLNSVDGDMHQSKQLSNLVCRMELTEKNSEVLVALLQYIPY